MAERRLPRPSDSAPAFFQASEWTQHRLEGGERQAGLAPPGSTVDLGLPIDAAFLDSIESLSNVRVEAPCCAENLNELWGLAEGILQNFSLVVDELVKLWSHLKFVVVLRVHFSVGCNPQPQQSIRGCGV